MLLQNGWTCGQNECHQIALRRMLSNYFVGNQVHGKPTKDWNETQVHHCVASLWLAIYLT